MNNDTNFKNPRALKTFKGYTVDLRLREFRKVVFGKPLEFVSFDSPVGKILLSEMSKPT